MSADKVQDKLDLVAKEYKNHETVKRLLEMVKVMRQALQDIEQSDEYLASYNLARNALKAVEEVIK